MGFCINTCCSSRAHSRRYFGAHGGLTRLFGLWRTRNPSRLVAWLALALTCALLSAGLFAHDHDAEEAHAGGDGHHCAICCLQQHFSVTTTAAPVPLATGPATHTAAASRHQSSWGVARATQATRGPPA